MDKRREYEELEIEIRSTGDDRYEVRVLEAPTSTSMRAGDTFVPPFSSEDLDRTLRQLTSRIAWESYRLRNQRDALIDGHEPAEAAPFDPAALAADLSAALFRANIRERYLETRARQSGLRSQGRVLGLRIRLSFDRKEDFAFATAPPWEFLTEDGQFLGLDSDTTIVRSLMRRSRIETLRTPKLRVLLVPSRAGRPLQLEAEGQAVQDALKRNAAIEVETLPRATLPQLREALQRKEFHILHFMGHGHAPQTLADDFTLLFESDHGDVEVDGDLLSNYIKTSGQPIRLVVLNACWGGAFPRFAAQNPFSGVASELIRRDIPAVVAMQQPIADDAAIAFSEAFYKLLAQGEPIGAAVTEGRVAMRHLSKIEWATPVLYLAANDDLFEIGPSPDTNAKGAGPALVSGNKPLLLEVRSFKDPFLAADREPDARLDLTRYFSGFENRYVLDPALWQSKIFPELAAFLGEFKATRRPLLFDFPAHFTLAYAAGYLLENKSGLDITLLQRGSKVEPWHSGSIPPESGLLWRDDRNLPRRKKCPEVALSFSVTAEIEDDVRHFLDLSDTSVGRQLDIGVPAPGRGSVKGEDHALQLVDSLVRKLRRRTYDERESVLHLFTAAPYSLLFFLGQHQMAIGTVQLYEHGPKNTKPVRPGEPLTPKPLLYEPSLRLPF